MDITDIRVRRLSGDSKLRAYVTVTFDGEFTVHNIKIIEGNSGDKVLAMPSRRVVLRDGGAEYRDIAHPINSAFRSKLQEAVFAQYESLVSEEEQGLSEEI